MTAAIGAYFDGSSIVYWTRSQTGERVMGRARAEFGCYLAKDAPTEVIERLRASSVVRRLKLEGDWYRLLVRDRDVLYRTTAPKVRDFKTGESRPGLLPGLNVKSYE